MCPNGQWGCRFGKSTMMSMVMAPSFEMHQDAPWRERASGCVYMDTSTCVSANQQRVRNTMPAHRNLIRVQAAAQEYDWGRQGSSSLAARLAVNAIGHGFEVDENKSYAEVSIRSASTNI